MADLSTPELGKLVERLGPEAGIDAVDLAMIRRGDMLGSELGAKVYDALSRIAAERDAARERSNEQSDYSIQLQRIIEAVCHGNELREDSADLFHHKMVLHFIPGYRDVAASEARASAAERERDELKAEVKKLREALSDFLSFASSVWFDESVATEEETIFVNEARAALRTPEESP